MIRLTTDKTFAPAQLERLFLSVGWSSGQYPDKLVVAMANSHSVISAWDGDQLVGLINVLSDGIMTASTHYLLVLPESQGQGLGRQLLSQVLDQYQDFARKVLIAYNAEVGFYQHLGFVAHSDKTPMFVTQLTT